MRLAKCDKEHSLPTKPNKENGENTIYSEPCQTHLLYKIKPVKR